jgi:hypothetical protein
MKHALCLSIAVLTVTFAAWSCGGNTIIQDGADASLPPAIPAPLTNNAQILHGWSVVIANGCAECHQDSDGSGILSGQLDPIAGWNSYGANLTPDADTGLDGWTATDIVTAIRTGIDNEGSPLCPPMPQFKTLSDDDAVAIAAYLLSLPAVHHDVPDSVCDVGDGGDNDATVPDDDGGADATTEAGNEGGTDSGQDAGADAADGAETDAGLDGSDGS